MDMKALGNLKSAEEYIIFVIIYGEMVDLSGQSIPLVQETKYEVVYWLRIFSPTHLAEALPSIERGKTQLFLWLEGKWAKNVITWNFWALGSCVRNYS